MYGQPSSKRISHLEHRMIKNTKFDLQKPKPLLNPDRKLILSRKYFDLWNVIIQYKKRNKYIIEKEKLFDEKIISFISHLRISTHDMIQNTFSSTENVFKNCKSDTSTKPKKSVCTEVYQNRFQAQKSIINNQKALIAEQNDIITKLKSSASGSDEHHPIIQYEEYSKYLDKSVRKTVSLPKTIEHPLVKSMKEREEGRKNRWSLQALRRKEKEKFIAEKLKEEEEERKRLEEEKRKIRIQEKREKERMMKELEIKKKREQETLALITIKANNLYKSLLCAKTVQSWRWYLKYLQNLQNRCSHIYDTYLLRNSLLTWKQQVISKKDLLHELATGLGETSTLLTGWYQWKRKTQEIRRRRKEITLWYDKEITRNTFKKWLSATYKSVNNKELLLQSIEIAYDRILLLKTFGLWKQLPRVLYIEREKEKRLREWESRVKSILPDYNMQLL